jgi:thiamine biosynthesis lipoprotein
LPFEAVTKLSGKKMIVIMLFVVLINGCTKPNSSSEVQQRTEFLMSTMVTISYYDPAAEAAVTAAFAEMQRVEALMSAYIPTSDVSKINTAPAGIPVTVSAETFAVIEESLHYAALTGGAFDITIGPVLELWDIPDNPGQIPAGEAIQAALALVDYNSVVLDREHNTVTVNKPGMKLDLGGAAKGYALDRAREVMVARGVSSCLIDAGGDIVAVGARPGGEKFRIGVRHPRDTQEIITVVPISDYSIVTSGDYQRFFTKDGIRYHHIFDPQTGWPANSGLISATILCPSGLAGDILSTAVFILGTEKGLALLETLPEIEGLLITEDMQIVSTPGFFS